MAVSCAASDVDAFADAAAEGTVALALASPTVNVSTA